MSTIELIDEYAGRIDGLLARYDDGAAGRLVDEAVSVFRSLDPDIGRGLDRCRSKVAVYGKAASYDNEGDLGKLKGKLRVMRDGEQRELESDPVRLATAAVDRHLAQCDRILAANDEGEMGRFVDTVVRVYGGDIRNVEEGLSGYGSADGGATLEDDVELLRERLLHYRANVALGAAAGRPGQVSIQNAAMASSVVENEVSVGQAAERIQGVPDGVLDEELKKELKLLLLDLDSERGRPKAEARGKAGKVVGWLSDKGVDVMLAALPYVVGLLQSLK